MPASPIVASWELGQRLRERRELVGLSGGQGAKAAGISPQWLSSVELGKKSLPLEKLSALVDAYEFGSDEAEELRQLREDAGQRGWWRQYAALFPEDVLRMFGFEHGAESVRTYSSGLVTGLLQTEDYARATITAGSPNVPPAEIEQRVRARLRRQRRLSGWDPLQVTALMSESTVRQQVGGPAVLAAQLRHLAVLGRQHPDTVELRVVPYTATGHPAMGGSGFYLMTFPSGQLPTIVHQETVTSTDLITDPRMVREYSLAYAEVKKAALSRAETVELIDELAAAL